MGDPNENPDVFAPAAADALGDPNENPVLFGGTAVLDEPNENPDEAAGAGAGAGAPAVAFGDPKGSVGCLPFAFGDANDIPDFFAAEVPLGEPSEKLPEVTIAGGAAAAALPPAPSRLFGSPPGFLLAASPAMTDGASASAAAVAAATAGPGFVAAVAVPNTEGAAELIGGNPPPAVSFDAKLPNGAAPAPTVALAPAGATLPNPAAAAVPSAAGGNANDLKGEGEEEAPKADAVVFAPNPPPNTPPKAPEPAPPSFLLAAVGSTSDPDPKGGRVALPLPNTKLFVGGGARAGIRSFRRPRRGRGTGGRGGGGGYTHD